MNVIKLRHSNY